MTSSWCIPRSSGTHYPSAFMCGFTKYQSEIYVWLWQEMMPLSYIISMSQSMKGSLIAYIWYEIGGNTLHWYRSYLSGRSQWCFTWWRHQMETFSALLALVRGIHRWPVNSQHKGQWRTAFMFCLICAWINGWVNNRREADELRRHRAHNDATAMISQQKNWGVCSWVCGMKSECS